MEYKYINIEYLDSVSGGDPEITREIVGLFREQVAEAYDQMIALNAAKDYFNLGMLAHKVKSSAAIMGMNALAVMLKTFELQAKEGKEPENYASYIERFKTETAAAVEELDHLIRSRFN